MAAWRLINRCLHCAKFLPSSLFAATPSVRQTVFADDPSSGRLNTQHSYLLMLSQWRISTTNRRKGAWSRAFICGAQIKWYIRRIACVLRCSLTTVRLSKGWGLYRYGIVHVSASHKVYFELLRVLWMKASRCAWKPISIIQTYVSTIYLFYSMATCFD